MSETTSLGAGRESVDLSARVVLVTGATGAIGSALALACAGARAQVILAARQLIKLEKLADLIETAGGVEPILYPVDLAGAQAGDYDTMAAAIGRECGRLDAVVHLAADFAGLTPLNQVGPEAWQRTLTVNVQAPMMINQSVHELLRAARGRIVFTLDDLQRVAKAYWGAYGVSKQALSALLSITAAELESDEITVLGMVPPPTRSRLRSSAYLHEQQAPASPEAVAQHYLTLLDPEQRHATGTISGLTDQVRQAAE